MAAVFFDLVYNHAGSFGGFDPQCLNFFDFQSTSDENLSLYFTDQGYVGGRVFAYWNRDIRQFLIDNAVFFSERIPYRRYPLRPGE